MCLWCVTNGSKKDEGADAPGDDEDDDSHRPSPESSYVSTLSAQNPK